MRRTFHNIIHDQVMIWLYVASFMVILVSFALAGWKWHSLPPQLPLFYSLPRGEDQLGTPIFLLLLPICSFFLVCLHSLIAAAIYQQIKLAARLLLLTATVMALLLCMTFVHIIFLIT